MPNTQTLIVYDSYHTGHWEYVHFIPEVRYSGQVTIYGDESEVRPGLPMIRLSENHIILNGSSDVEGDVERAFSICDSALQGYVDSIRGIREMADLKVDAAKYTMLDPISVLRHIDKFEGFRGDLPGMYNRVLIAACTEGHVEMSWIYIQGFTSL